MNVIIGVTFLSVCVLELLSIVIDVFGWRTVGSTGLKESAAVRWRRISLHVGVWVLVIGGFWALLHFGPLRPVHEWLR
jgi:nitrate reductase gamma subunit